MIRHFQNGPFLHAIAWSIGRGYTPQCFTSNRWGNAEGPLRFGAHAPTRKEQIPPEAVREPLADVYLKRSGVARARSAPRSTVLAAVLGKELAGVLGAPEERTGDRVGVGIVASTVITPVFWEFESVGITKGWNQCNPMLLPASIPSGVPTAVSSATGCRASAITFADGPGGVAAAIEHAYLDLRFDRADAYIVIAADEVCEPISRSMDSLGLKRDALDGASGLLLTREPRSSSDWQICFAGVLADQHSPTCLPELDGGLWRDALRLVSEIGDRHAMHTGVILPMALLEAVKSDAAAAVVEIGLADAPRTVVGLKRAGAVV